MSLIKSDLLSICKKQFKFKVQTGAVFFVYVIAANLISVLFSMSTTGMSSTSNGTYSMSIITSSTIPVIILSMFFTIYVTLLVNSKDFKNIDFTFISNRISSNISNIAFLITFVAYTSITTVLAGVLSRVMKYIIYGSTNIIENGFFLTPGELILSFCVIFLYILLISSFFYIFAVLVEISKLFFILIPSVIISLLRTGLFQDVLRFYINEHNLLAFSIKILLTTSFIFIISIFLSNNLEVRK